MQVIGPAPADGSIRRRILVSTVQCSSYCSKALGGAHTKFYFNLYIQGSDLVCSCCTSCDSVRSVDGALAYSADSTAVDLVGVMSEFRG